MDGENRLAAYATIDLAVAHDYPPAFDLHFAADSYYGLADAADRRARLADMVVPVLAPRLDALRTVIPLEHATAANVAELARLVLSADGQGAATYVTDLRQRGLSLEILMSELLEPAAQRLGELWDQDEVDFIDVTLGVARLQAILSLFNGTYPVATKSDYRSVLMLTAPGEQHSFGVAIVEQFLEAGGWQVTSERETSPNRVAKLVENHWFAVAGIALSNGHNLDKVADMVEAIRACSLNKAIGVMVGGPVFSADPAQARAIGADGMALSGPTAVVLAQKLLDCAVLSDPRLRSLSVQPRP